GFDGTFSSLAWWDLKEGWFLEEYRLQQGLGLQIAFPEAPFSRRTANGTEGREVLERRSVRALQLAAHLGGGLLVPMGFEYGAALPLDPTHGDGSGLRAFRTNCAFDISAEIRAANTTKAAEHAARFEALWLHTDASSPVSLLAQADHPDL